MADEPRAAAPSAFGNLPLELGALEERSKKIEAALLRLVDARRPRYSALPPAPEMFPAPGATLAVDVGFEHLVGLSSDDALSKRRSGAGNIAGAGF